MINRAVVSALVTAVLASLISAAVLQAGRNTHDRLAAESSTSAQEPDQPLPQPSDLPPSVPPSVPSPPLGTNPLMVAPSLAPVPPPPPTPSSPPAPLPKPTPKAAAVKGTPCLSSVSACVKLSTHQAWLLSSGKVIFGPVSITSGKRGQGTPAGMHRVLWKDAEHKSKEFHDAPMPWSVFFADGGIAFHTGSLRASSNGCVHLANSVVRRFFATLSVGDLVQILR
jgi:lipoprotein-anchoring transpeptidase ErfK/SrfK